MVEDLIRQAQQEGRMLDSREEIRVNTALSEKHSEEGLTETQKAMRKMKANMSVINNTAPSEQAHSIDSPLKARRLSIGGGSQRT